MFLLPLLLQLAQRLHHHLGLAVHTRSARILGASLTTDLLAWLLLAAGSLVMILALFALRGRAALPSTRDPLVRQGPYAHVRHPIHSGLLLALFALVLISPTRATLLACLIAVVWIVIQSRLEEIDLLERLPSYRAYMREVPRFIPRVDRRALGIECRNRVAGRRTSSSDAACGPSRHVLYFGQPSAMKPVRHRLRIVLFFLGSLLTLSGCSASSGPAGPSVHEGAVSIAILILDYRTYGFEGATVLYYPPCDSCAADSLPFSVRFRPPGDFGDILFTYAPTGDPVFAASIIWMGTGGITFPRSFDSPGHFTRMPDSVPKPGNAQCFRCFENTHPSRRSAITDSIWAAVATLNLVHEFQHPDWRVGYYLYPPRVGIFDPTVAKWIVFLCRAR